MEEISTEIGHRQADENLMGERRIRTSEVEAAIHPCVVADGTAANINAQTIAQPVVDQCPLSPAVRRAASLLASLQSRANRKTASVRGDERGGRCRIGFRPLTCSRYVGRSLLGRPRKRNFDSDEHFSGFAVRCVHALIRLSRSTVSSATRHPTVTERRPQPHTLHGVSSSNTPISGDAALKYTLLCHNFG